MPTNENTYNSRVTSEALEAKFRQVFPSQGGAELVDDLYASGVIQPVIDFSSVAEGSVLSQNLQTAWDFSTGSASVSNTTTTLVNNTGFWLVDVTATFDTNQGGSPTGRIQINDGATTKVVWGVTAAPYAIDQYVVITENKFVVFLRAGDTLEAVSPNAFYFIDVWYRQIADVNGNLKNPLGFSFS